MPFLTTVNPDFKFLQIEEKYEIPGETVDTGFADTYQLDRRYIFFGLDGCNRVTRAAVVSLVSFSNNQLHLDHRVDLFKNVIAIQKGKETIDGKQYWFFINKLLAVPEKVFFALEDEGYRIANFKCGITKSYWKVIGNDARVFLMIT